MILEPNFDAIPQFLRDHPYWSAWPAEPKPKGGFNKRPLGTNEYYLATNQLRGWDSFTNTKAFFEANQGKTLQGKKGPISGVGILLKADFPLVGIDFDHVLEADGTIAQWAKPFIEALKTITYCEISPSKTGIHALIQGKKPAGICRRGDLEIYDDTRFLTVTGHKLPGCPDKAGNGIEAQDIIDKLVNFITNNQENISTGGESQKDPEYNVNSLDDSQLINKARQARFGKGIKFSKLFDSGDISQYPSASEADLALADQLAFWTRKDAAQMDRLMRKSALLQTEERLAKWDKIHSQGATYGEITISKAIQDCKTVYTPPKKKEKKDPGKNKTTNPDYFPLAQEDLAVRFIAKHKNNMRYCLDSGKWHQWNNQIWEKKNIEEAIDLMRTVCKEAAELAGTKERKSILRIQLYRNALEIAQGDKEIRIKSKKWDSNKFLLGTPDGTVDLKTGQFRNSIKTDYITKITSVSPNNTPPSLWLKFLDEATAGNKELQRFMQQISGMVLTGDTSEQALFFVYGPGGNGKSVFITAITEILHDYAVTAAMETFISSKVEHHPTDLAMLQGARLVTASETEEGRTWAESKIKQLTGGDKITARFMRQDYFTFLPEFKLIIIGNHKPRIKTLDDAIKRRVNIIPFIQIPQKKDQHLSEKLRTEYPSILQWMIEGCLDWQQNGLQRPKCVKEATQEYFEEQDIFEQWLEECCILNPQFSCQSSKLFESWKDFAENNNIRAGDKVNFSRKMERKNFEKPKKIQGIMKYKGITLKNIPERDMKEAVQGIKIPTGGEGRGEVS